MYGSNALLCRAFGSAQAILSISTIATDKIGLSGAEGPTTDAGISQPSCMFGLHGVQASLNCSVRPTKCRKPLFKCDTSVDARVSEVAKGHSTAQDRTIVPGLRLRSGHTLYFDYRG